MGNCGDNLENWELWIINGKGERGKGKCDLSNILFLVSPGGVSAVMAVTKASDGAKQVNGAIEGQIK